MTEPTTAVLEQLEQATTRRAAEQRATAKPAPPAPRILKQPTLSGATALAGAPTAGNGTAQYLLLDHYFGGSSGTLWTYDGSVWRAAGTAEPSDEQGMAQVAFAANRVDMWWDDNDAVTVVRCWKYF